jgi:hypothetical protein
MPTIPPLTLATIPLEIDAKLLEKIRASAASIAPGKRGKLVASIDLQGNLSVGLGAKVKDRITIGAVVNRDEYGRVQAGATATIEWAPAP